MSPEKEVVSSTAAEMTSSSPSAEKLASGGNSNSGIKTSAAAHNDVEENGSVSGLSQKGASCISRTVDAPSEKGILELKPPNRTSQNPPHAIQHAAASSHPSGILRNDKVPISFTSSTGGSNSPVATVTRQTLLNGIPLAGIMFLDLANSADFPANVFNETNPVPRFAIILMAIGGTFALVMSTIAFIDARRSYKTITQLRAEQIELQAKATAAATSETDHDENPTLNSFLHLNRRDLGTEFFERFGMELFMGAAGFMVAVGTYMAIGGDNEDVFFASNILSGYLGNGPAAFYGIINAAWSVVIFLRAGKQRRAASTIEGSEYAQEALYRRARFLQIHASWSGVVCLISGALGMVTPTQWEPYPVLAALGIAFAYTTWLFRRRIGYVRAGLAQHEANITTADLVHEIDALLGLRVKVLAEAKEKVPKETDQDKEKGKVYDREALATLLQQLTLCDLFQKFCVRLLKSNEILKDSFFTTSPPAQIENLIKAGRIETLTPEIILTLADQVYVTPDSEDDNEGDVTGQKNDAVYQVLGKICARLLRRKAVLKKISMRSRFLLELLGSHMISFPEDRATYKREGA